MAYGRGENGGVMLKVPHHKAPASRVARKVDKEGHLGVVALLAAKLVERFGTLPNPP